MAWPETSSRGAAFDDLDNDWRRRRRDLYSRREPNDLRNESPGGTTDPGAAARRRGYRNGIGARITVTVGGSPVSMKSTVAAATSATTGRTPLGLGRARASPARDPLARAGAPTTRDLPGGPVVDLVEAGSGP